MQAKQKKDHYKVTRILMSAPFGEHQVGLCELKAPAGMVTRSGKPVPGFGVAIIAHGVERLLSTGQTAAEAISQIFGLQIVQQRASLSPQALALVEALEALDKQYKEIK